MAADICEAWLAQSVEHETLNLRVVGSSPTSGDSILFFSLLFLFVYIHLVCQPTTILDTSVKQTLI